MKKRRGLRVFLIFVVFFLLVGFMFLFGLRSLLQNKPRVAANSVLQLTLTGLITEQFPRDAFSREFESASVQMEDIRKALAYAKIDDRIEGLYLKINSPDIGWAKAEEIRQRIETFKESGKFVIAHLTFYNEKAYYLALAADSIYAQPHAYAEFNGFAAEVWFLRNMFDKLGIRPEVENIGKYKSAGDMLKRKSMSPAHREATEALLAEFYDHFIDAVCTSRHLEKEAFKHLLESGIYQSEEAYSEHLFDGLAYETEIETRLLRKVYDGEDFDKKKLNVITATRYARIPPGEVGLVGEEKMALVYAVGDIMPGGSGYDPVLGRHLGAGSIIKMLNAASDDASIKAIVLRVDSPGGSAVASDEMWAAIEKVRKNKPVVISMSDVAASGGYMIAMNCDAVVAQPLTITGSIGVVTALYDLSGTYKKLGINWETVKTSEHADMPTDKRPMNEKEWQQFRKMSQDFYHYFVQKTADARGKSWDEVNEFAQGRVWTGRQAMQHGLVDTLGGLGVAEAVARKLAGLDSNSQTHWVVYPQPKGFLQSLADKMGVAAARWSSSQQEEYGIWQQLPVEMRNIGHQLALLERMRSGSIMAVAPFIPVIE